MPTGSSVPSGRKAVAAGVYRDRYGYELRWRDRGVLHSKRFPADTPLDTLKAWRKTKVRHAQQQAPTAGSFTRDAVRFLALRKGRPSFKSDRAHLRVWIQRFRSLSRFHVTREHVEQAMTAWRLAGYSARELRHRLQILEAFYHALDGAKSATPCDDVKPPPIPRRRPVSVADDVVRDVALNLWKAELRQYLRDGKTRGRYLVLATTGQRPAQVMRALREDVDLERRLWFVRPAKGDYGTTLYLNDDMIAAWQVFIQAQAWGAYDSRSFCRVLRRNGWPKGIRPYNLRHSVGLGLSEREVDLGDIQSHMGHASPTTTRIYVPGLAKRAQQASVTLDGRIGASHAALPPATTTIRKKQKAKIGQKRPHSATVQEQRIGARASENRKKYA